MRARRRQPSSARRGGCAVVPTNGRARKRPASRPTVRPSLRSVAIALLVLAPVGGAGAAKPKLAERVVTIEIGGSKLIRLGESISRVSNAAPEIADVAPFPPDQVLLTGKRLGQTMATLWTSDEEITPTVIVGYPVDAVTSAVKPALPHR